MGVFQKLVLENQRVKPGVVGAAAEIKTKFPVEKPLALSSTRAVNWNVPVRLVVPDTTPDEDSEIPLGRLPADRTH
jgi:hypothetical protein